MPDKLPAGAWSGEAQTFGIRCAESLVVATWFRFFVGKKKQHRKDLYKQ